MDKKGKLYELFSGILYLWKSFKQSYLYRMVSKFLSIVCSIILVILLIIGGLMFYFNTKIKAYNSKGIEYTAPFGLYTIISGSMEPNVQVYDVVIAVDQDVSKIKVGDVITFISNWEINFGKTITHRVAAISKTENGEIQLTTKGDNNPTSDGGVVTQDNLVGKVVGRIPQLGRLQFYLATKAGWFFVVFIPAMIIIIVDTIKIFKLYVLKNKIDKVKTPTEAEKEVKKEQKKVSIDDIISGAPKKESVSIEEKTYPADENIDTVELPKVGEDGVIKENTSELPVVPMINNKEDSNEVDIMNAPIDSPKKENDNVSLEEIDIPKLRSDVKINDVRDEHERKTLKPRG